MSASPQATETPHADSRRSDAAPLPYVHRPALRSLIHTALGSGFTRLVLLSSASAMGKTAFIEQELAPAAVQWGWDVLRWSPEGSAPSVLFRLFDQLESHAALSAAKLGGWGAELQAATESAGECARLRHLAQGLDQLRLPLLLVLDGLEALGEGARAQLFAALSILSRHGTRSAMLLSGLPSSLLDAGTISPGAVLNMQLPVLEQDYLADRLARLGLARADGAGVAQALALASVGHVPQYMDALMRLLAASGDLATALDRWKQTAERNGFSRRWTALRELDQRLLSNVVQGRGRSLYTRDFSSRLSGELTDGRVVNPQKIQTAINRLVKANILYPTVSGGYEIQDSEMATFAALKI